MTVTAIESAPSAQQTGEMLYLEAAEPLWRAVSNALLFAGPAKGDAPLHTVRFVRDKDGTLEIVSSDRYRLFVEKVEHRAGTDAGEFAFSLSVADAKQLATVLKGAGKTGSAILVVGKDRLRVDAGPAEITLRFLDGYSFPEYRRLILQEESALAVDGIAFNAKSLSDLGKLKLAHSTSPACFQFFGHNKPAVIRIADGPTIVHMPVRLSVAKAA